MDLEFPQEIDDFLLLPNSVRHDIAMNFAATGLGAMVHSTANTLDWALARLLNKQDKLDELIQLMSKNRGLDLTQEDIFDKNGALFPVCEWVLHNAFLYPTFSHEFFLNRKPYQATLTDGLIINVPSMSFIVVNYLQCNRSNEKMNSSKTFSDCLSEKSTTGRFIMDENVASFGGGRISRDNPNSRICPGAKTSLYEQMIIIAILLRDFTFESVNSNKIICDVDRSKHPLCMRVNVGEIILKNSYNPNPHRLFSPVPIEIPTSDANIKQNTNNSLSI